ncbi:HAMP domain-containing sensor histidine kinase [Streptomyces marincola]|uniref:HAMP domain-containing sensor histidine kinase n=1 Tax=Streptomyces marincola TaxID=2878388 RepID=UPI001C3FA637|nr:HAMP domain-containing sensor histidine kinase [Streptomyces marincola]
MVITVYLALSATLDAEPLNPVEVPNLTYDQERGWVITEGATFRAADFESVEKASYHKTLGLLRSLSLQAIGVLFLASLVTGWWLSGRALRPVREITSTARDISATDLSRRIALDGPRDELRALADTLDSMLDRLEYTFATQRQIVGDASHELLNPLAVIRTTVEAVLASDSVSPAERATSSAAVVRATALMTRLVEDLLASSRRDSPAFVDADVDVATLADDLVREYAPAAGERGLRLERSRAPSAAGRSPVVSGDPQALSRAVGNLLSNAVRLAPEGSTLTVGWGVEEGWVWIAVADEGPGVADADQERVFDRFFSGSGGTAAGHSGLGLAIVRQIVEGHDGRVALHSAAGEGSTFVLWFPDRSGPTSERPAIPHKNPLAAMTRGGTPHVGRPVAVPRAGQFGADGRSLPHVNPRGDG